MKNSLCSRVFIALSIWFVFFGSLYAESAIEFFDDSEIRSLFETANQELSEANTESALNELLRTTLPNIKSKINACLKESNSSLEKINRDLEDLGESSISDTPKTRETREKLIIESGRAKEIVYACKKLENDYEELIKAVTQKLRDVTADRLTERSSNIIQSISASPIQIPTWFQNSKNALRLNAEASNTRSSWIIGLFFVLFGGGLGWLGKNALNKWMIEHTTAGKEPFELNLVNSLNPLLPLIGAGLLGFLAFINVSTLQNGLTFATRISFIAMLVGILLFAYSWLCKANSPGDTLHSLNKDIPKALVKRLRILTIPVAVGYAVFGLKWLLEQPGTELVFPYQVLNIVLSLTLLATLQVGRDFPDIKGRYRLLRVAMIAACVLAIPATLLGYMNAANYLLFAVLCTAAAGFLLWILVWGLDTIVNGIVNGKTKTSYKLRASLGIKAEEQSSELGWIRLLFSFGLWLGFGLILLIVWDFTDSSIASVQNFATDGFSIGKDTKIIPKNIVAGLITFAVVLSISVWFKARLERQWLRNIGMDRGSRDAIVTLTGYMGTIIAVLMGLTAAGVSFTGLALVAGALSVGIGFGLQNIVNNFISGLILLFERPIHSGDYISVGNVEGTVKRISIRSTEIETMQRTNVIVPNSELISGQVTNWVLHDNFGVIHVPVGVAYGSDVDLVKKLLLEVAHAHQDIVARPNMQQPTIRFKQFGDSSLNFAIVALVKNINRRFDIISEINYEIDRVFRENNIAIPFPQRDLHIKTDAVQSEIVMPEILKPVKSEIVEKDEN